MASLYWNGCQVTRICIESRFQYQFAYIATDRLPTPSNGCWLDNSPDCDRFDVNLTSICGVRSSLFCCIAADNHSLRENLYLCSFISIITELFKLITVELFHHMTVVIPLMCYVDGWVQGCCISITNALEIRLSCLSHRYDFCYMFDITSNTKQELSLVSA